MMGTQGQMATVVPALNGVALLHFLPRRPIVWNRHMSTLRHFCRCGTTKLTMPLHPCFVLLKSEYSSSLRYGKNAKLVHQADRRLPLSMLHVLSCTLKPLQKGPALVWTDCLYLVSQPDQIHVVFGWAWKAYLLNHRLKPQRCQRGISTCLIVVSSIKHAATMANLNNQD